MARYEDAVSMFNEILQANPKFDASINNRGFAYLLMGEFDNAEVDFQNAISLNPDAEVALANLASLYVNTDRSALARPLVSRLLILAPSNPDYSRLWSSIGL